MMDGESAIQLPVGTVTFLLADLEGSTLLWERSRQVMVKAVARMYEIVDEKVVGSAGVRPIEQGEGDSVVAAFARASDALSCSFAIQLAFEEEDWPEDIQLKLRIGLHTGEAQLRNEGNYFGQAVIRGARLRSAGHGGQILLSQVARDLVIDALPEGVTLKDLGLKRLRDLSRPERVYQLSHAKLPSDFPELLTLDELPNNLPVQLTTFIGREAEIAENRKLLESSRILTLTGSGGCGKTRLALQVAADVIDAYPDGVWWVDLAPLTDPELVPVAVAGALSIREVPMQELVLTIANHLRDKKGLIVLDNCEHLIAACHALAETLLQRCPALELIATSREPLGVAGETTWRVPSLSLPDRKKPANIEALTQCEAVRLFVDRAVRARPNFQVTNDNAPFVAEICHRLDGIPLAIELAAARTRVLTAEQISAGLADRVLLLTGGTRTALPRQRTLEASVDWSHNLLSEDERILLRRLSVFAGGFNLDAAEAVCEGDGIERFRVLDLLAQLVDKSLIQMDEVGGEARYRLLETIRHFARQKLSDAGESPPLRSRHLAFYVSLVEYGGPQLAGSGLREWNAKLELENDNIRAAAEWGLHSHHVDEVLRMCGSLFWFWFVRGRGNEGRRMTETALATAEGDLGSRANALVTAAGVTVLMLEGDAARAHAEEAAEIGKQLGDERIVGRALCWLAWGKILADPKTAAPIFEEVISICEEAGDSWYLSQGLIGYGVLKMIAGRLEEADKYLEAANALARRQGDYLNTRESLTWLGYVAGFAGRFDEGLRLTNEALALIEEMQDEYFKAIAHMVIGWIEGQVGHYERARSLINEAIELARKTSNLPLLASAQAWLATLEYQTGNLAPAKSIGEEALKLLRDIGFKWGLAVDLLALHGEAAERNDIPLAKRYLEEAEQVARDSDLSTVLGQALLAEARSVGASSDPGRAEALRHEALALFVECKEVPGIAPSLEGLARTAIDHESSQEAARLLGAADAIRESIGLVRFPLEQRTYDQDVNLIRNALGKEEFAAAHAQGLALSTDEAVSFARRARGDRKRPSSGWASLTPTEMAVVRLVAEGLTNPQIGERMLITAGTVKVHLSHVFTKLGISTRSQLAAEATRRNVGQEE